MLRRPQRWHDDMLQTLMLCLDGRDNASRHASTTMVMPRGMLRRPRRWRDDMLVTPVICSDGGDVAVTTWFDSQDNAAMVCFEQSWRGCDIVLRQPRLCYARLLRQCRDSLAMTCIAAPVMLRRPQQGGNGGAAALMLLRWHASLVGIRGHR